MIAIPSLLEISANITLLLSAFFAARNNKHTWTIGIISCLLFTWLFFESKLYADVTLQLFFIATSIYGWFSWINRTDQFVEKPITTIDSISMMLLYAAIGVITTIGYGLLLYHYTDAFMPFVDTTVLCLSVFAQLALMNRKIETWALWIGADVMSVVLYFNRELYLTSAVYSVLTINAIYGLYVWYKEYKSVN